MEASSHKTNFHLFSQFSQEPQAADPTFNLENLLFARRMIYCIAHGLEMPHKVAYI